MTDFGIAQRPKQTVWSNSARATSRWESQFRIEAPNSIARDILVIALDHESAKHGASLAGQSWKNTKFVQFAAAGDSLGNPGRSWEAALNERDFDLVVMIGTVGQDLSEAAAIGETCVLKAVKVSGVLLEPAGAKMHEISAGLRDLRPWTHTLAVMAEDDDLPGLLHALGA